MPGPPTAPLRHGEAISASGDSEVLQICQANLREGWLKRAKLMSQQNASI